MTALAANRNIGCMVDQQLRSFKVGAARHIYRDGWVGKDPAGMAKPFEPGDELVGLAYEEVDNSAGAAAAKNVRVRVAGDFTHAFTSIADKDAGKALFATDDATLSFSGHPDAYVGRVLHKEDTNLVALRLKTPGEKPLPSDTGCLEIVNDFLSPVTVTGATAGDLFSGGLRLTSALGLGVKNVVGANGGVDLEFDAVAEVAHASVETEAIFLASKGVTFEARLHLPTNGDAAAFDADWGLGTALTANSRASIDHADMVNLAAFHMDGASTAINAQSDNNVTDVAPVDTTIVNDATALAYKEFKAIVRPAGTVELWIDGVRVLPSTVFAVATSAVLCAFVLIEKTSDDTTAVLRLDRFRAAGARS